jgi:hypothetical protein
MPYLPHHEIVRERGWMMIVPMTRHVISFAQSTVTASPEWSLTCEAYRSSEG